MTINEAINRIDNLRHNFYTRSDKVSWLSKIDGMIFNDIISTHEDPDIEEFTGYTDDTEGSTVLLAEYPYEDLYGYYMESMIDYYNGEYDNFNNSNAMFQSAYTAYRNRYNQTHMPKQISKIFF